MIDGVEFDRFDVDHVAVGPTGVFAIETKWTSVPWSLPREGLSTRRRHAVDQAQRGAGKIRLLLGSRGVEVAVMPVVVVWGPGARLMRTERLAETLLLVGTDANNLRSNRPPVTPEASKACRSTGRARAATGTLLAAVGTVAFIARRRWPADRD